MPATDSPAIIVARFLKANHYTQTFEAFIAEAGLPEDAGDTNKGDWTIETILEEKKQYDTSLAFEKKSNDQNQGWTQPAPSTPNDPDVGIGSNVLCVYGDAEDNSIIATGADRSWTEISAALPFREIKSLTNLHGSPILSAKALAGGFMLSTSMSGQLLLHHSASGVVIDKCRHHAKYAVQVATELVGRQLIVATAGWDQKVHLYGLQPEELSQFNTDHAGDDAEPTKPGFISEPFHTITLPSNPESILFVRQPDTQVLYLILSRRDSTHLYYYSLTPSVGPDPSNSPTSITVSEPTRQNLAPHSNAWISFTPSSLSLCPTDPSLVAIATSHLPHMKLIIVRLLFPSQSTTNALISSSSSSAAPTSQAAQTRQSLALADREETAIRLHVSTMAPQTPYSTPQVVWRPDGSGVFVNGDDGAVRGIEAKTGKVVAVLKGHEPGTKVRTLWCGLLGSSPLNGQTDAVTPTKREVLVSGGFDKRLIIWTPQSETI